MLFDCVQTVILNRGPVHVQVGLPQWADPRSRSIGIPERGQEREDISYSLIQQIRQDGEIKWHSNGWRYDEEDEE